MNWTTPPEGIVADLVDEIADAEFVIGDVVSLIVGGPDMVVLHVCAECGEVAVAWIDSDGDVQTEVFPEEVLV